MKTKSNKELLVEYFKKYFKHMYINDKDNEFEALLKILNDKDKKILKEAWNAGCAYTTGSHKDFKQIHPNFDEWFEQHKKK